eukprot:CAMPEP_0185902696 /NCGR_PEP_ID=MMETSP0196C-20130402/1913_1 /TAXON_ID=2932 /ORGANISM="Alexandrium fundyense, Strain CCMP1719" /LENGTH=69 /DNA_ID=CAMNT_0028621591 /DNA_START=78 /DNA_END=284 /DNA_ORIENTATION=-
MLDQRGELTNLVQAWAQQPWDLRDQDLRGQEAVERLRKLLHKLLVLVELLQVVHALEGDARLLRLLAVH